MNRSVHTMDFVVETTGIADHRVAILDPPPQRGLSCPAVAAAGVSSLLQTAGLAGLAGLHQRPVGAVHLMVETAGIAEIVASVVPPPEWGVGHSAVNALSVGGQGGGGGG